MNLQDSNKAQFSMPLPPIPPPFKINKSEELPERHERPERPESRRSQRDPKVGISNLTTTPRNNFKINDKDEWSQKVGFNTDNDRFD